MPELKIVLYTREDCCLCDKAISTLVHHGLRFQLVDIDEDPELREKYDLCVPVVEINERERFRGRIDELLLRRIIIAAGG